MGSSSEAETETEAEEEYFVGERNSLIEWDVMLSNLQR